MRTKIALTVVALLTLAGALGAAGDGEPAAHYFAEVSVPSLEAAGTLSRLGYDVAGVDRQTMTVGVVVTLKELEKLRALGWVVTLRSGDLNGPSRAALANYTDPQELSNFIDQIVADHPDLAKKIVLAPTLWEGQTQYAVLITKNVGVPNDRPSFILDAQHHAREVMTPEIAMDMMDFLTSRYASDSQVARWVDNINIYVVPSVNPDGAKYVFTTDAFWRKNRHPGCAVDVNRNYPGFWGNCNGSSADCSSEINRGAMPGSEPETQGMMQLTASVRPFFTLSYHSYGELIMYPYGCSDPDEMSAFQEVGQGLNAVLRNDMGSTGQYAVGPIWSTIYLVDGGSIDTQYRDHGAYGFTIEVSNGYQTFQPDYATWRNITVVRQRTAWSYFLDKTLDGPQIRATVTDAETGLPLPAEVGLQEVTFTHGELPRNADAAGRRRLLVHSAATYHVRASHPGYCPSTQEVTVGTGPVTADFALSAGAGVPTGVTAAPAGDQAIDVSWQAVANADAYRVLRSLSAQGPYAPVATVPSTETVFHDLGVSGVVTYHYVVRSIRGCESSDSAVSSAATTGFCTVSPAFTGVGSVLNAGASTCTLTVTWPPAVSRCGGAVTYSLYRSATAPFVPGPGNLLASGLSGTSFIDHGALTGDNTYSYIIRAVESGNGADDGNSVLGAGTPSGPEVFGTWLDDAGDSGTARLTGESPWSVQPTGGNNGPRVYATGIYPDRACISLTTPPIPLADPPTTTLQVGPMLSFASKEDIQSYADAGIVEIATGPGFDDWTKLAVNYPDFLYYFGNSCGFPIDGVPGTTFSHEHPSPAYPSALYKVFLTQYAGQIVKFRWRLSTGPNGNATGWWVDDISVTRAMVPGSCTAGTAPNPKEASADGAMKASRLAGTGIDVTYAPGCGTLDNAVYWGTGSIVGAPNWTHAACAIGNSGHATFDPGDPGPDTLLYFVVVGQSATYEGSYGPGAAGERLEAVGVGACDKPQVLTGSCP